MSKCYKALHLGVLRPVTLEDLLFPRRRKSRKKDTQYVYSGQCLKRGPPKMLGTGRIPLRRARFQTPNSVSFLALTEFRGELSEFFSAYYLCAKANSPSFSQNSPSLPQNSVTLSEFSSPTQYSRNSIPPVS